MRSKISFFNPNYMKKNILLYWPLWVSYAVALLLFFPGNMWTYFHTTMQSNADRILTQSDYYDVIGRSMHLQFAIPIVFTMAILVAMVLNSYLYTSRSANMIHALPVTRLELYVTNVVTGLAFMIIPQMLAFLVSVFVSLSFGAAMVEYIGIWFLVMSGFAVVAYAMATFCAMLVGQLFALPIVYGLLNFGYLVVCGIVDEAVSYLGFGLQAAGDFMEFYGIWLSPAYYLMGKVNFRIHYGYQWDAKRQINDFVCQNLSFEGGRVLMLYVVASIAVYVIGYLFYRKRQMEQAGNPIAVCFLKPIFRWGFGICAGFLSALLLVGVISDVLNQRMVWLFVVLVLVLGVICFYLAQMILEKTFRVFARKQILESVCFVIILTASFVGINSIATSEQKRMPQINEIKTATIVNYPFDITYEGSDISTILNIQQKIVDNYQELRDIDYNSSNYTYIQFRYALTNGKIYQRYYPIATDNACGDEIDTMIYEEKCKPNTYANGLFETVKLNFKMFDHGDISVLDDKDTYENVATLTKEQATRLAKAVYEDAMSGSLQKYNVFKESEQLEKTQEYEKCYSLSLDTYGDYDSNSYEDGYDVVNGEYFTDDEIYGGSVYVTFGRDCTHILNALVESEVITSLDELKYLDK